MIEFDINDTRHVHQFLAKRAAWLIRRKLSIGASEHAALLGLGYASQTPTSIWASKVMDDEEGTDAQPDLRMLAGNYTETAILEWLCDTLRQANQGEVVSDRYQVYTDREHDFLSCSPDGLVDLGDRNLCPVEAKSVYWPASMDWSEGKPPLKFQIQLQHQMRVLGVTKGILAAFVNGEPRYEIRDYNADFMACSIETTLIPFWQCVKTRTPPPPDGSQVTTRAMARFFTPREGVATSLGDRGAELWKELEQLSDAREKIEKSENLAKQEVLTLLAGCEEGLNSDGTRFSWKTIKRKAYTVQASESNQLMRHKK